MTTAELENVIDNNNNNSHISMSETTRKVFFPTISTSSIIKPPSTFLSQNSITTKGLYPPTVILLKSLLNKMKPTRSNSVPIKLITMPITQKESTSTTIIESNPPIQLKKSISTPIIPKLKKPTLIDNLITSNETIIKAPRPSSSTRTVSQASVQLKSSNSIKLTHKKKKTLPITKKDEDEEEDIPITKPISQSEKRKRQAKRADQIKIWKVREEREAREARLVMRRKLMNTTKKESLPQPTIRKKKKRVKFDFDKNCIIQLENNED